MNSTNDPLKLIQTIDEALSNMLLLLNKMKSLSIQASKNECSDDERAKIQKEIDELVSTIDYVALSKYGDITNLSIELCE